LVIPSIPIVIYGLFYTFAMNFSANSSATSLIPVLPIPFFFDSGDPGEDNVTRWRSERRPLQVTTAALVLGGSSPKKYEGSDTAQQGVLKEEYQRVRDA
jgi:hypothetical protein